MPGVAVSRVKYLDQSYQTAYQAVAGEAAEAGARRSHTAVAVVPMHYQLILLGAVFAPRTWL
jgi:hypothetical protein